MSHSKTVLLFRTHSDATTETTYHWAETVKQHFLTHHWKVIDLAKDDAVHSQRQLCFSVLRAWSIRQNDWAGWYAGYQS
jgi:hypothetical protein